jgi:hypothetical protein
VSRSRLSVPVRPFPQTLLRVALTLVAVAFAGPGCGGTKRIALAPGTPQSASYKLVCPSVLGNLTTMLTYSVTASVEPAPSSQAMTFSVDAPIAQVNAPITATFISSSTTFAIPPGFAATGASTSPVTTADFTSSSAVLDGGFVTLELAGSFPLDGTPRPVPALIVSGTVSGAPGTAIVWSTPIAVDGTANAGSFFGTQSSDCSIPSPGPIGSTSVVAASE